MRWPGAETFFNPAPAIIVAAAQNGNRRLDRKGDRPTKSDGDRAPLDGARRLQLMKLVRQITVENRDGAVLFGHEQLKARRE